MKKVIVTGGSRGIGAEIVRRFAENGDAVAFVYRSDDSAANALAEKTGATPIKADVSVAEQAAAAVARAIDALSGVDVLVNCAGIAQIKLFLDLTDEDWRKMIDTDLSGAFYCSRAVARKMVCAHSGKIINIGSVWGRVGASCEVHYSAAKSGLRGMTQALAKELGPSGITVNCVEPGVIDTEMNGALDEKTKAEICEETPIGRMGTVTDVADAVLFLASADFITGQCLGVDGGFGL
ncbi:MAG: 3-oxoacyl-ACP reductase FabG [Ruminococcaceae bacterium]|nr:3-oxoacyl-ACP reductase FabG [Oscillospiraceae bacterium]